MQQNIAWSVAESVSDSLLSDCSISAAASILFCLLCMLMDSANIKPTSPAAEPAVPPPAAPIPAPIQVILCTNPLLY